MIFGTAALALVAPVVISGSSTPPARVEPASGSPVSPRLVADGLFVQVMSAAEAGDSLQLVQTLPLAIDAYDRARPLDTDGLFHLSTLQRAADRLEDAHATAQEALSRDPDHILVLYAAAQAAAAAGDGLAARAHYRHLVDVWGAETALPQPDYEAHASMMTLVRTRAEEYLEKG